MTTIVMTIFFSFVRISEVAKLLSICFFIFLVFHEDEISLYRMNVRVCFEVVLLHRSHSDID